MHSTIIIIIVVFPIYLLFPPPLQGKCFGSGTKLFLWLLVILWFQQVRCNLINKIKLKLTLDYGEVAG